LAFVQKGNVKDLFLCPYITVAGRVDLDMLKEFGMPVLEEDFSCDMLFNQAERHTFPQGERLLVRQVSREIN
jgi:hypothetical protein